MRTVSILSQRPVVLRGGVRDDAVGRGVDPEAAHVGVVGGEQHADVSGDAGDDDAADAQIFEQRLERRIVEPRVLRLEHEVVAGGRAHPLRDAAAGRRGGGAMGHRAPEVRAPLAEVVVDVDRRHAGPRRPLLEPRQPRRHRLGLPHEGLGPGERHVVHDVDQQQRGRGGREQDSTRGHAPRPARPVPGDAPTARAWPASPGRRRKWCARSWCAPARRSRRCRARGTSSSPPTRRAAC